jgi:hypothetical protein
VHRDRGPLLLCHFCDIGCSASLAPQGRDWWRGRYPDPLVWLDAASATGAFREVTDLARMSDNQPVRRWVRNVQGLAVDLDGCTLIQKSVALRPDDLSIEFGAALIAIREIDGEGLSP